MTHTLQRDNVGRLQFVIKSNITFEKYSIHENNPPQFGRVHMCQFNKQYSICLLMLAVDTQY